MNLGGDNGYPFIRLGLDKSSFCFKMTGYHDGGQFPLCHNIQDLSKLVYALQREWVKKFGVWPDKNTVDPMIVVRRARRDPIVADLDYQDPKRHLEKWIDSGIMVMNAFEDKKRLDMMRETATKCFGVDLAKGNDGTVMAMFAASYPNSIRMAQSREDSNVKLKFGLVHELIESNNPIYCERKPVVLKEHLELQEKPLKTVYIRFQEEDRKPIKS